MCENERISVVGGRGFAHLFGRESPQRPLPLIDLRPNEDDRDVRSVAPALGRPPLPHFLHRLVPVVSNIKTQHKRISTCVCLLSEVIVLPSGPDFGDGERVRHFAVVVVVELDRGFPRHPRDLGEPL